MTKQQRATIAAVGRKLLAAQSSMLDAFVSHGPKSQRYAKARQRALTLRAKYAATIHA